MFVAVCEVVPETVPLVCLLGGAGGAFLGGSWDWSTHILALFGK